MRYTIATAAALMASVSAQYAGNGTSYNGTYLGNATVVYTTEVVTAFTTFCPAATEITYGSQTYTVTAVS